MAYPTDIDSFPDPTPTAPKTSPSHSGLHNSINTAVEALETEVGTTTPAGGSLRDRVALLEAGGFGNAQPAIIVASVDAPQVIKDAADYECDGTADQVEINAAIVDAAVLASRGGPSGAEQRGNVVLSGGQFTINGSILMRTGVWLSGCGSLTEIKASSLTAVTGAGPDAAMIKFVDVNVHLTKVSNFWLHGNFSSGGACHGINYYALAGSRSGYPDSNPDADNLICDLYIHGFTTGTRHGIYMNEDVRGTILDRLQIRQCSGNGIFFLNAPDSHLNNCHVGTITLSAFRIDGANCKITNCKGYFADVAAFTILAPRTILSDCESQDSLVGFDLSDSNIVSSSLLVDTSSADGIIVNGSQISLNGFVVLVRAGGRYGTQTNGIRFVGTPVDTHVTGVVVPANITTKVSGTFTGARNFVRISDGTALRATTDAVGGGGAFAAVVANLDTAAVGTGKKRFYNDSGRILLIQSTRLSVGTAPAGQAIIGDIHKNETTIFTTQSKRPQIAIGAFTDQGDLPDVTSWNPGEYLTFDLDQVGTSEPGRDVTFVVWVT